MKLGIYNYTSGCDNVCKSVWRCDTVGGLDEHVTCHVFWFLIYLFNFRLGLAPSPQWWTDFDDEYVI